MYQTLIDIGQFIDHHIIDRIHFSILFILLFSKIQPSIDKIGALQILRFVMLTYSLLTITELTIPFIKSLEIENETWNFLQRTKGWYFYSYLAMMLFNCVIPLLLFSNYLASKTWLLLTIAVLMNFGKIFERFVITVTSLHRDYPDLSTGFIFLSMMLLSAIVYGICSSVIAISLSLLLKKIKKPKMQ